MDPSERAARAEMIRGQRGREHTEGVQIVVQNRIPRGKRAIRTLECSANIEQKYLVMKE